tara:strand:+ start:320 stop:718 length:399 start_codon:yes stop_codon:yes gene_type:complete
MTPEQTLNRFIVEALPAAHCQRIESSTGSGIPDINVRWREDEFWIESKANAGSIAHVRPAQFAWMMRRVNAGGTCFVIHRPSKQDTWNLYVITNKAQAEPYGKNHIKLLNCSVVVGSTKTELRHAIITILTN